MAASAAAEQIDSGIRVVVTPAQSSYFAGELFSVTITFVNTRRANAPPNVQLSRSSSKGGHKRAAHSISSVPLARPPTSPGLPRSPLPALESRSISEGGVPGKRGLVGKKSFPDLEQSRKRLLARSLSVDIAPDQLKKELSQSSNGDGSPISASEAFSPQTPYSPPASSPLARSPSQSIPRSHPHARKQSVMDGQAVSSIAQSMSQPGSATTPTFPRLDPIAEMSPPHRSKYVSAYPPSPSNAKLPPTPSSSHNYPPRSADPQSGLGHGPPPGSPGYPPYTASTTSFPSGISIPNTELILYSYAQLTGDVALQPIPGVTPSPEQERALQTLRAQLLRRAVVGGGSMNIAQGLQGRPPPIRRRSSHSRTASLSSGLISLIGGSGSGASPSQLRPPVQRRLSGAAMAASASAPAGFGLSAEDDDPEIPLPTFEVQPSMLAVDLSLRPGESRSYTYSIMLPAVLPPTFKGRVMRFSYELVVGTCRAGIGEQGSVSKVMKVPIRVYNNVDVSRPSKPYDLLWPVARRRDVAAQGPIEAVVTETSNPNQVTRELRRVTSPTKAVGGTMMDEDLQDLQDYAQRLVSLTVPGTPGIRSQPISPEYDRRQGEVLGLGALEGGSRTGCRESVEILTRISKKASYDVTKDGVKVAVLTFTKSAYRLGETVLGVVEVNEQSSRARVLKLAAILEAHETLPSTLSPPSPARHTRRIHAEHHAAYNNNVLRTVFALDIPSDASPAFKVQAPSPGDLSHASSGGLSWKVRLCLLVAIVRPPTDGDKSPVSLKSLVRAAPRGAWGSAWRPCTSVAPLEKIPVRNPQPQSGSARSWASFITASFLGGAEGGYHDGDEMDGDGEEELEGEGDGKDGKVLGDGDEGWQEVRVETVECEVPVMVWPGNTAFKAMDVVFDV